MPHSEESERAVLAAVMLDSSRHLPTAAGRLRIEDFYFDRHQRVFLAMLELQNEGTAIDMRTLQAKLEQKRELEGVGGIAYLAALDVDLPDLGRVESYVEIVKERSLRRRLMSACQETYRSCQDGGLQAREALAGAEQAILQLGEEAFARGFVGLDEIFKGTIVDLEERPDNPFPGLRTGFADLDVLTHGLHPGHLVIIAGRPGMGKTSLALNIAQNVTMREGKAAGIFSLEMGQQELALRILCSESDVPFSRLRAGRISQREWRKVHDTVRRTRTARLFVDDAAAATLLEVSSKARRLKLERGLDLVIVDYLQLMQAGGRYENRNLEIGAITRGLKQLAKELQVPVLCLSQLSRQPERRGSDHRPQLADLRESGCLVGETLIPMADTGERVPIRELVGRKGFAVWALDAEDLKLRRAQASAAFSTGTKMVWRLMTRLGRTIRATGNHRFLTFDGWRRLDELEPGDFLTLARQVQPPSSKSLSLRQLDPNPNRDVIPKAAWSDVVVPAMALAGMSQRQMQAGLGMSYCGSTLYRSAMSRDRAVRVAKVVGSVALLRLAQSDLYWDQIAAIESDGLEEVFDLTVPGPHNFLANDIVVHNSIEQDADLVAFVYRDEVYNKEDLDNKGLAELIIAKHRSGETGMIELAFIGDTTSFRNLEKYGAPPPDLPRSEEGPPPEREPDLFDP